MNIFSARLSAIKGIIRDAQDFLSNECQDSLSDKELQKFENDVLNSIVRIIKTGE